MKVLWHHADLKNLQNAMTCCASHYSFVKRVAIHRDWVRIKSEVEHSLRELDEDCRAQVDAIQHKKGSGSEQVFCSERRIWEAPLK
jgi:hypothetical protein